MKKPKKSGPKGHPRSPRVHRKKRPGTEDPILGLRRQIRDDSVGMIHEVIAATARQIVEDEIFSLAGDPWSRKCDSPLWRGGTTETTLFHRRRIASAPSAASPGK